MKAKPAGQCTDSVALNLSFKNNGNHSLEGGKGSGPVGLLEPSSIGGGARLSNQSSQCPAWAARVPTCSARARLSLLSRPSGLGSNPGLGLGDQQIGAAKTCSEWLIILEPWVDILPEKPFL